MIQKVDQKKRMYLIAGGIALVLICISVFLVKLLLTDDGQKRNKQIQMVTVVKPPPPPKVKEKPPEPEVEKKEEIIEPEQQEPEPEPMEEQASDEPPPGQDLGLDAEGGAGSDSFGLKAKKGGRSLIGGQFSKSSLLIKYGWYTRIIQNELRKKVNKYLEENGGIPDGDLKAIVQITLDETGNILEYAIVDTSGNAHMDEAVQSSLAIARISAPPPIGMPRTLKLKISAKG